MKYCPNCGAELIPGALSFCSECGKALPVPAERTMPQDRAPPRRQRKEKPPKERKPKAPHKSKPAPEPDQPNLDYDGYYDDVPPVDLGRPRETANSQLVLRVCGLLAVVVLVIAGCAAALFFL